MDRRDYNTKSVIQFMFSVEGRVKKLEEDIETLNKRIRELTKPKEPQSTKG